MKQNTANGIYASWTNGLCVSVIDGHADVFVFSKSRRNQWTIWNPRNDIDVSGMNAVDLMREASHKNIQTDDISYHPFDWTPFIDDDGNPFHPPIHGQADYWTATEVYDRSAPDNCPLMKWVDGQGGLDV